MVKITWPKCYWCKAVGAWKCKRCGHWSCSNCLVEITRADRCVHKEYKPVPNDGW